MEAKIEIPIETKSRLSNRPQLVAIERKHFEVLTKQANVHFTNHYQELESVVCLPNTEYEGFLEIQGQYANLVRNLLASGMPPENVWELAKGTAKSRPSGADARLRPKMTPVPSQKETSPIPSNRQGIDIYKGVENAGSNIVYPPSPTNTDSRSERHIALSDSTNIMGLKLNTSRQRLDLYPLKSKRSVVLEDLPVDATAWDVTSAIRGGALVEFVMVATKRMAVVSFVSHESAAHFFEHSKKRGIFVKGVKVSLRWAEHQYMLTPYISNQAASGATRNIVVKACQSKITEDRIRQDLEHIHRLVVIKVEFINRNCHIKTNSIQLALYAKTCMRSRSEYHRFFIDFDRDECDQPLTVPREDMLTKSWRPLSDKENAAPPENLFTKARNRFASLEDEGNEDVEIT